MIEDLFDVCVEIFIDGFVGRACDGFELKNFICRWFLHFVIGAHSPEVVPRRPVVVIEYGFEEIHCWCLKQIKCRFWFKIFYRTVKIEHILYMHLEKKKLENPIFLHIPFFILSFKIKFAGWCSCSKKNICMNTSVCNPFVRRYVSFAKTYFLSVLNLYANGT